MLQDKRIYIQTSKVLKNRTIDIICRGVLIKNASVLNKYYKKETIIKACKDGCPNFGKKWSCPPLSKDCHELLDKYSKAILISLSTSMNNYMDIKNKYIAIKAANITLKNLIEKTARKIETKTKGYALLSGSCRLCKSCACKNGQQCKHPDQMRYSIEASYLNVQEMCEELMGLELLWYKKKRLPEYTSTVAAILFNYAVDIELISQIIEDEIRDY